MLIATSYPGLMQAFIILCALFCIPAGLGFLAFSRFGRRLWVVTLGLGLMSAFPSGYILAVTQFAAPGALPSSLLPLVPFTFGLLLCILSIPRKNDRNA